MKKYYILCILSFTLSTIAIAQKHQTLKQKKESIRKHKNFKNGHIGRAIFKHYSSQFKAKQAVSQKTATTNQKKLDSIIGLTWDANSGQWIKDADSYKFKFIYDANKNNSLDLFYRWDVNYNVWVEDNKEEYTYDSNGNAKSYTSSFKNSSTNQ